MGTLLITILPSLLIVTFFVSLIFGLIELYNDLVDLYKFFKEKYKKFVNKK